MTHMNHDEAMAKLESAPQESLAEWCYESHKDFYGVKGRHLLQLSQPELVAWIKSHFVWDCDNQYWRNAVPFID